MNIEDLFYLLAMLAPFFSAAICCILFIIGLTNKTISRVGGILIFYFLAIMVNWLAILLFFYVPSHVVYVVPILLTTIFLVPVLFYHFIYRLTGSKKIFPIYHYLLPTVTFLIPFIVPEETRLNFLSSVENDPSIIKNYLIALALLRVLISFTYTILSFTRIIRYRNEVFDYSANEDSIASKWLYTTVILSLLVLIIPVFEFTTERAFEDYYRSFPMLVLILIFIFLHIYITYHVLRNKYVIIREPSKDESQKIIYDKMGTSPGVSGNSPLKKQLESYLAEKKPYTYSDLKITDLIGIFNTTHPYLSEFIHKTYKMNFCCFINKYRIEEYERLRKIPENIRVLSIDLLKRAGFSSYKGYLRARKRLNLE